MKITAASLTNQEWLLVFSVFVALFVFIAAVIFIVYALFRALKLAEEQEQLQAFSVVTTACRHKEDKVVLQIDGEPTATTQTNSPFTCVDPCSPIQSSPPTAKIADEDTSTLDVEFEKSEKSEKQHVFDYNRELAETEFLMNKLRKQLTDQSTERKVMFNEKVEIMEKTAESPSIASPEVFTPLPAFSPIVEVITPPKQEVIASKKKLDRDQLPPLKSFTPPRVLTPHVLYKASATDKASLFSKTQRKMPVRQTFKRPHDYKSNVHPFSFE